MDDLTLLREYATRNSEAAFAELVSRRVGFVYSAALRQVRDPHLAEEITQAVFIILAQKAGRISNQTILAGWLFKTTRFVAIAQTRTAAKRSLRRATLEQEVKMQTELQSAAPDPLWEQLSPLLDEALATLGETDRQAVLLRFFENKSLAEVGSHLGTGEDTARKRVSRALEKLHRFFSKRGVASTAVIIAGAMSANSAQAAPALLAKSVTAVAMTKGVTASGSTLTLIKGALKIMAWTKMKTALVVGVAAILVVGTPIMVIPHYLNHSVFTTTKELSSDVDAQYARLTGTTPEQVAKTFFEACSQQDWTEVAKFWPPGSRYPLGDNFKNAYGGLQVVSLGKPFWGWIGGVKVGGAFVPYEIRLKNGEIKKFQLQVRCDNPDNRWYFDGGL